jgi:hypothetical protein
MKEKSIVPNLSEPSASVHPTDAIAYIDTVELFFRYVPKGMRRLVDTAHGKRVRIETCKDESGMVWG